jgi:hypothetical protein
VRSLAVAASLACFLACSVAQAQSLGTVLQIGQAFDALATTTLAATTTSAQASISSSYPMVQVTNPSPTTTVCLAFGANPVAQYPCPTTLQVPPGQTLIFLTGGASAIAAIYIPGSGASGTLAINEGYVVPISDAIPTPVVVVPYQYTDLGPCQITVSSSAVGLTGGTGICSGGIPAGATIAVLTVETEPMRWAGTGATNPPTQTFGNLQNAGTSFQYSAALANFRMIDTSAGNSTVDVEFFK